MILDISEITTEVQDGIFAVSLPLNSPLKNVNVYVIETADGHIIIDSGCRDEAHKSIIKEAIINNPCFNVTGLLISHFHPDHVGLADWISESLPEKPRLYMTQEEWLATRWYGFDKSDSFYSSITDHFEKHGFDRDKAEYITSYFIKSQDRYPHLPPCDVVLRDGDTIEGKNGQEWKIVVVSGHSVAQPVLVNKASNTAIVTDVLLETISPNLSVWPHMPRLDPVQDYNRDLSRLKDFIDDETLILPGHRRPFKNGVKRINAILDHNINRSEQVFDIVKDSGPVTVSEFVEDLYNYQFNHSDWVFGTGEAVAHINHLLFKGEIEEIVSPHKKSENTKEYRYAIPTV